MNTIYVRCAHCSNVSRRTFDFEGDPRYTHTARYVCSECTQVTSVFVFVSARAIQPHTQRVKEWAKNNIGG
jgi:DNA-directed RNA polymerase subunit RPC12/RpoP